MGVPIHLSRTPGDISGPAPAFDQTNASLAALLEEARDKKSRRPPLPNQPGRTTAGAHSGITVIDFSSYIAGGFGPMILAQMAATVIKIEGRDGDSLRHVVGFRGWNQSKRGLGLDAKSREGLEIVYDLVRKADVFVENLRRRDQRFGLDYELCAIDRADLHDGDGLRQHGPDTTVRGLTLWPRRCRGVRGACGRSPGRPERWRFTAASDLYQRRNLRLRRRHAGALGCILALRARSPEWASTARPRCSTPRWRCRLESLFLPRRPDLENGAPELRGDSALHRAYQCADGKWLYISVSLRRRGKRCAQVPTLAQISFEHARLETPMETWRSG